ncbi:MAG: radical SAM family heme chaperone HemW [Ginsengibacter sp.]
MAGIYIHIPFCKQACHYCNFHFSTSLSLKDEMTDALKKEIALSVDFYYDKEEIIETIYFGGGTPSLLHKRDIEKLLFAIKNSYSINPSAEITLEANPDDITIEKLNNWKDAGINRLSIGVQSFKEEDLLWMNRVHTATESIECINMVNDTGLDNFSVDLIYGIPSLTDEEWHKNVQKIINLEVPHVACYALTVEPKTALQKMIQLDKKKDVDPDNQARQFSLLMKWMRDAGYEHYEISNFAKPGFRSRHNSSYWKGDSYLGIGPSAHSYNGKARRWNIANNALYIQSINKNVIPFEEEILTKTQQLNEYIMTSLRTMEGLDLNFVENRFSINEKRMIEKGVENYITKNMIFLKEERLILTDHGKLFADGIASDLFVVPDIKLVAGYSKNSY